MPLNHNFATGYYVTGNFSVARLFCRFHLVVNVPD